MTLELHRLQPEAATERAALTAVVLAAPRYSLCVRGRLPHASDVDELLHELPPAYLLAQKHTFGIYDAGVMIGCADVLKGWKHERQCMLGLLLLAEAVQGQGVGRRAYDLLEQVIRRWPGIDSIRIGVISTNAQALGFWRKRGFIETGEQRMMPGYTGPLLLLEKPL